jgi:iron(III) transport system substrate-binding protein
MNRRSLMRRGIGLTTLGAGSAACMWAPKSGGKLLVYTSIAVDIANQITNAFTAKFPDIQVDKFQIGSEALIRRIETERRSGGIQADVIMIADPSYYMVMKMRGDLAKHDSPEGQAVPHALRDPDGYYAAVRIINMGLVYNTKLLERQDAPKNWGDLSESRWAGQIVMSNPRYSGSTYATVATLSERYGWDYFRELRRNKVVVDQSTQGVERRLAAGEFKAGIGIDYAIRQGNARGSPLGFIFPHDGAVVLPSPIAAVKKKDKTNFEAAKVFYDFMLSKDGQAAIVRGFMVPVRPDLSLPEGMPGAQDILQRSLPIDWVYLATEKEEVLRNWRAVME